MALDRISGLHARYVRIYDRFKAAWIYHQFLEGLGRVFAEQRVTRDYPLDIQGLYERLKEVSAGLQSSQVEPTTQKLDSIEKDLSQIFSFLADEDSRISPSVVRQFFQRVQSYDQKVLTQMVRFHIYSQRGFAWSTDQIDKVDYLMTKLAEAISGADLKTDMGKLRGLLQSFWALSTETPLQAPKTGRSMESEIEATRARLMEISSFPELESSGLVESFRAFKHELGSAYFNPSVSLPLLSLNLLMKAKVQKLYSHEERRLFADYERLGELEQRVEVGDEASQKISSVHQAVQQFESLLQADRGNVRFSELTRVRQRVRDVLPELDPDPGSTEAVPSDAPEIEGANESGLPEAVEQALDRMQTEMREAVGVDFADSGEFHELYASLAALDELLSDEDAVNALEVKTFNLEAREVRAFHRLHDSTAASPGLETFLLIAASIRHEAEKNRDDIADLSARVSAERRKPAMARSTGSLRMIDVLLARFSSAIEQAYAGEDLEEARSLQLLRMRLLKAYAELWLLTYPESATSPDV